MMTGALSDIFQSIEQSQDLIYAIWRHCLFQFRLTPILRRVPFAPRSTSFISSSHSTPVNNGVNGAHQHANDQVPNPPFFHMYEIPLHRSISAWHRGYSSDSLMLE